MGKRKDKKIESTECKSKGKTIVRKKKTRQKQKRKELQSKKRDRKEERRGKVEKH